MVGTLAEGYRPTGFGFGETMFQIFILNATRRLQADRFYTDCYTEEYYTKEGLDWIDRSSLKHVILRHYPELVSTGLGNIKNAFEPWDTGEKLDAARQYCWRMSSQGFINYDQAAIAIEKVIYCFHQLNKRNLLAAQKELKEVLPDTAGPILDAKQIINKLIEKKFV